MRVSKERTEARIRVTKAKAAIWETLEGLPAMSDAEITLALSDMLATMANAQLIAETKQES